MLTRSRRRVVLGPSKARRISAVAEKLAGDLADACVYLMQSYNEAGLINIGTGEDIEIGELALLIKKIVGYEGEIIHDLTKPDGTPRKLMDVSKLHNFGWKHKIALEEGIRNVYADFKIPPSSG